MIPPRVLLVVLLALPLVPVIASLTRIGTERLRAVTVGTAVGLIATSLLLVLQPERLDVGHGLLRIDELSVVLVPLPAALWLVTVGVTPRAMLERAGLPRTALATLATTVAFLTESGPLLLGLWLATTILYLTALSEPRMRRSRRAAAAYLLGSTACFAAGLLLRSQLESLGLGLIVLAVVIRKAIFPFHAWLPETFDRGSLGPSVLFSTPQLGSYVAAVLVLPSAGPGLLRAIAVLSLFTAVYGAALAAYQRDARRACGYLFVSQSALVLAGLDCDSPEALAGSLILWISSALAFAGLARCVLVVEARRGRLDLTRFHGGYEQMPLLAVSFLVFGLACTGFPGTLGFVGQELLVGGAVSAFPLLGFAIVVASATTGFVVLRMYFSLFCGRRGPSLPMRLRRREALVFGVLAASLILAGTVPGPLVASRLDASRSLMQSQTSIAPATHPALRETPKPDRLREGESR